ncbi:MAG: bifunctional diguanylate cyclase/phosphodiesterase [Treponema sp.]|nr:bifunctional diguanylate cyclase/phosphodiesterase [Treponema sp.]
MILDDNFIYIVDSSQKVVYFNESAKKAYPKMEIGKACCECTGHDSKHCANCPSRLGDPQSVSVFSMNLMRWANMSCAKIEYPGHGECIVITGSFYNQLGKELLSRIKFPMKFNFILEMNLSLNRYHLLSEENFGKPVVLEEEYLTDLIERTAKNLVHPDDYEKFKEAFDVEKLKDFYHQGSGLVQIEVRERSSEGRWDNIKISFSPEDGNLDGQEIVLAIFEIELPKVQKKNLSERNVLTGLYDIESFKKAAVEFLQEPHGDVCAIYLDIEHFRFFNKWYSRWQGDRLLKQVGISLMEMDRMFGSVSGYGGGDDFFILCDKQDVVLEYLVNNLNKLISSVDGIEGFRMLYGGYVLSNKDENIFDVLDSAETAARLNSSMSAGKIRWYDESLVHEEEQELKIVPEFERALEEREFTFFLQPKCSIQQNKIVGSEALVRWKHKSRGFVSPGEFIPPLERNGLIAKLDSYVWEEVCKKIAEWKEKGITPLPVSVNVSRIDIFNLDVPKIFSDLIQKYQIEPELVEIEITESAFVDDIKLIRSVIQDLRHKGFTILIDDFGSGYSSLNMLKDVQADIIKMDIKFFDLNQSNFEKGLNIIQSVVDMAHGIGLPVIAEGVETQDQIDLLNTVGLDYIQGYYFYRPLPVEEYEKLVKEL